MTISKKYYAVLVALFTVFILTPVGLSALSSFGVPLPKALSSEEATLLDGAYSNPSIKKSFNLEGIASGEFQNAVETRIKNELPFRAQMLLGNAAVQRSLIKASNAIFGFEAVPTFYGSKYSEIEDTQRIVPNSFVESPNLANSLEDFAKSLDAVAAEYPNTKFVLVVNEDSWTTPANPTSPLISNSLTTQFVQTHLYDNLSDNVTLLTPHTYTDTNEYNQYYMTTDHHWNVEGVRKTYEAIAHELGLESLADAPVKELDAALTCGQAGRLALDPAYPFTLKTLDVDTSSLTHEAHNKAITPGNNDEYETGLIRDPLRAYYNGYHYYFGGNEALEIIRNSAIDDESKRLIFVSDSYGIALMDYLALNYSDTYKTDPFNNGVTFTLPSLLDDTRAQTVVIMTTARGINTLEQKNPNFVDGTAGN